MLAGCGSSGTNAASDPTRPVATSTTVPSPTTTPAETTTPATFPARKVYAPGAFDRTDALLDERVRATGVSNGIVKIVAADGTVIHEYSVGGMTGSTPMGVASSTKWFTAATFMTFVDQGVIKLRTSRRSECPKSRELTPQLRDVHNVAPRRLGVGLR